MRRDRPDLLAQLVDACHCALRELDGVDDTQETWGLRADIIEVAHEAEQLLGRPFARTPAPGHARSVEAART